ncbi:ADP-ribose pyrophosphatase, mitochondrial-like isoform X2 [Ornithodoros turicata]
MSMQAAGFKTLAHGLHTKCRNAIYPGTQVMRLAVSDNRVPWSAAWPEYNPPSLSLHKSQPWADMDIGAKDFSPRWNALDGKVDRSSHEGPYEVRGGVPLNPHGRTGLAGRGRLGRWGPNHAADPIVTRWKRDVHGNVVHHDITQLPVLQFVAVARKDCGEWAIPGGMVDPGELASSTLRREFCEESLNSLSLTAQQRQELEQSLTQFFTNGTQVYKGYVDDPRNTDNSWMETIACNFHDEDVTSRLALQAGDDAARVRWTDIEACLPLYASHTELVHRVVQIHAAHW